MLEAPFTWAFHIDRSFTKSGREMTSCEGHRRGNYSSLYNCFDPLVITSLSFAIDSLIWLA